MLRKRIITALVLLLFALPALFHPDEVWLGIFGLLLTTAAAWEWGKLNGLNAKHAMAFSLVCLLMCLSAWQMGWAGHLSYQTWLATGGLWVMLGGSMLRAGLDKWQSISSWVRLFVGILILSVTWLALLQAKIMGSVFLLSVLSLVWIADIAAYFAGRRWGRHKLAPSISPGKSWEGVLGGMVAVLAWSFAWLAMEDMYPLLSGSIFSKLMLHGWVVMVFGVIFLTLTSVMGDLIESLVKRSAGAKDSSGLLPGHGGVLDRLDALLPALPISIMLSLV